jgi:hypothetical protein
MKTTRLLSGAIAVLLMLGCGCTPKHLANQGKGQDSSSAGSAGTSAEPVGTMRFIGTEIDYHAVLQADLSPDLKGGSELNLRGISVFEFSGGNIVRLSDYS